MKKTAEGLVLRGAQDETIYRDVYQQDCYGLRRLGFRPEVMIDVGAHIGCCSRLALDLWPGLRLGSIEPVAENFHLLAESCPQASLYQAACSYEPGPLYLWSTLHAGGVSSGGSFVADEGFAGVDGWQNAVEYQRQEAAVTAVTLEQVVEDMQADRIDLLKLDCEGKLQYGEWSILRKSRLLYKTRVIVGEYHGERRQQDQPGYLKLHRLLNQDAAGRWRGWELKVTRYDNEIGMFQLTNKAWR